ncbi:MAG: DNA cytosine methyltransferase [Aureliella sp.]
MAFGNFRAYASKMLMTAHVPVLACPELRVIELFAGIGGMAAAWPEATVLAAIDINQKAQRVYQQNFSHRYCVQEIESLSVQTLRGYSADCWWMSPPCQPFSRRGTLGDLADPRCGGFSHIVKALERCRPNMLGLENVVGFENSQAHRMLLRQLEALGYHSQARELCPTQMGWPNRRPRFYLLASQDPLPDWRVLPQLKCSLASLIDPELVPNSTLATELMLPASEQQQYFNALDRVSLSSSVTACFAGSYGKTILHAGSYLKCGSGYRRFSPREVARQMGFGDTFRLDGLSRRATWKLLGNSLSLPCVRYVLSHLAVVPNKE